MFYSRFFATLPVSPLQAQATQLPYMIRTWASTAQAVKGSRTAVLDTIQRELSMEC